MYIGDAHVDFETNIINGRKGQTYVEPKVMRLLKFLAETPNIVISRDDLITAVWGVDFGGDERLSRAISLLRKALGEDKGRRKYIETISRGGYRLIAEVSETPPETTIKPKSKTFSYQWIVAGLGGAIISAATIMFFYRIAPSSTAQPIASVTISEQLTEGYKNIEFFGRNGAVESAQNNFASILRNDPDNAAAHAGLALTYIREFTSLESDPALLKQARASALTALEKNEHLALSYIAMGWSAEFLRERDKARQYLERADLLDKNNALIMESRIRMSAIEGNIDEAQALAQSAMSLHPNNSIFPSFAANLYLMQNDLASAENHAQKAIALDPQNPWLYSSAAHTLHLQNKTTDAIRTIQAGLEIQESASLYNNLGTYLFFEGYYDLAASAYEKTLDLEGNSHDPLFWANLGDAYRWVPDKKAMSEPNYKRALQLWAQSLETNPDNLTLRSRIALYKAKLKSGEKPDALIAEVKSSDNLEAAIYYRMLITSELWGDRNTALNLLKKSINSGYPLNEIRNDPELKALREDQAYHLIVSQ